MTEVAEDARRTLKDKCLAFCDPLRKATPQKLRHWAILVGVYSSVFIGACYWFQTHYYIGVDTQVNRCIDGRLFIVSLHKRNPVKDQIYAFKSENAEPVIKNGRILAKYVRGVPGDKITITPDEKIYVNDKLIAEGMAHLHGVNPKDLRKFFGTRVLGPDEFWMMGTKPLSFDSRYYGPVKGSQISGRAYLLF